MKDSSESLLRGRGRFGDDGEVELAKEDEDVFVVFVLTFGKIIYHMYFRKSWKMYTSHEDIGYDFEDDPKDKKTLKPHPDIDGGWAWMMVLSSFFVHILIMGSQMALGILNVEWLEEFHQSRGLTAWVSSLSMGITLIVGMFRLWPIIKLNNYKMTLLHCE